jgi:hypothetical protein
MRKIIVLEFISLDDVHTSPGWARGRYQWRLRVWRMDRSTCRHCFFSGHKKEMTMPFDLSLGRRTFDIWPEMNKCH